MRDESWNFLSTFLENLPIEVLFYANFDGMVQIVDFRQAITIKNYNLSFCTCLDKYTSFLAFSIIFWRFWPIEHLPPLRNNQLGQSFSFACFEGQRSDRNACASPKRHLPHFATLTSDDRARHRRQDTARPTVNNTRSVLQTWFSKVSEKCHFELTSGNFHEVLPDFLVFWKFYSNGVTETQNFDNVIEFSIKKYLYSQIFKKGTQKMPALVPHPTVAYFKRFKNWRKCQSTLYYQSKDFISHR